MADHWNTTFASGRITLSNSNLTANATLTNSTDTIISVLSHSSGKWYVEMTVPNQGFGPDLHYGFSVNSIASNQNLGTFGSGAVSLNWGGGWSVNGSAHSSSSGNVNNSTIGFAIDLTNDLIWFRNTASPTTWYGNNTTGDPVAGTNGLSISALSGLSLFLCYCSNQNGNTEATTMNSGGSAFAAAAPTGYTGWEILPFDPAVFLPARRNRTYLIR